MVQIFRPNANLLARVSIFGTLLIVVELVIILGVYFRSNYFRQVHIAITQPVPYSHQLHADTLGIDCRYCHTSVDKSSFANIPPTETCMTCHALDGAQVVVNSTKLEPVRESWRTGEAVKWVKVHDLPDFVYFNHNIHVNKGVGCATCHGQINQMPVVWKEQGLYMGWCLDCHRQPEKYLRPREEVFNMDYVAPSGLEQLTLGARLVSQYGVRKEQLTNCYICHR